MHGSEFVDSVMHGTMRGVCSTIDGFKVAVSLAISIDHLSRCMCYFNAMGHVCEDSRHSANLFEVRPLLRCLAAITDGSVPKKQQYACYLNFCEGLSSVK